MPRPRMSDWIITPLPVTLDAVGGPNNSYTLTNIDPDSDAAASYLDLIDTFYPQVFYRSYLDSHCWYYRVIS